MTRRAADGCKCCPHCARQALGTLARAARRARGCRQAWGCGAASGHVRSGAGPVRRSGAPLPGAAPVRRSGAPLGSQVEGVGWVLPRSPQQVCNLVNGSLGYPNYSGTGGPFFVYDVDTSYFSFWGEGAASARVDSLCTSDAARQAQCSFVSRLRGHAPAAAAERPSCATSAAHELQTCGPGAPVHSQAVIPQEDPVSRRRVSRGKPYTAPQLWRRLSFSRHPLPR